MENKEKGIEELMREKGCVSIHFIKNGNLFVCPMSLLLEYIGVKDQPLERIPEETKDDDELERVLSNMLGDFERGQGCCELEDFVKFVKEREDIARKEASKVEPLQNGEREEVGGVGDEFTPSLIRLGELYMDEKPDANEIIAQIMDIEALINNKVSQSKKECIFTSEELRRIRKIVVEAELPLKKYLDVDIQILKKLSLYEESLTNQKKVI